MLQLQKRKLPNHTMLSPLQPTKENTPSLLVVTIQGYQTRYQSRNVNSTYAREPKLESGRELTKRNLLLRPDLRERSPQTVLFQTRQGYNKPGSAIGAGDLRSPTFHADLHAE